MKHLILLALQPSPEHRTPLDDRSVRLIAFRFRWINLEEEKHFIAENYEQQWRIMLSCCTFMMSMSQVPPLIAIDNFFIRSSHNENHEHERIYRSQEMCDIYVDDLSLSDYDNIVDDDDDGDNKELTGAERIRLDEQWILSLSVPDKLQNDYDDHSAAGHAWASESFREKLLSPSRPSPLITISQSKWKFTLSFGLLKITFDR